MASRVGDSEFATTCKSLSQRGSKWIDANLFNGEYYEQRIRPPKNASDVAACLQVGMGAKDPTHPDFQIGKGCLVDQLVGQYMSHICGLGYLVDQAHVRATLAGIMKYNYRDNLYNHFNSMRSFGLGDESVLLMADYPRERPENPFPYFSEEMTGFEYTAAVGMLYEGQKKRACAALRTFATGTTGSREARSTKPNAGTTMPERWPVGPLCPR